MSHEMRCAIAKEARFLRIAAIVGLAFVVIMGAL